MTAGSTTLDSGSTDAAPARLGTEAILVGAILVCLALQLHLVFTQPISWDEFRFLADVHRYSRGELSEALQTFHVHFFGWLLWLPFDEIGQIIAARLAMIAVEGGTVALIYRGARHFMPVRAALVAALGYVSFSFVVVHGASFRFDPPSIALLMTAAVLLLDPQLRIRSMLLAGVAVALAGLITIKSAFMLPTLAALAVGRVASSSNRPSAVARLGVAAAAGLVAFAGLYAYHAAGLSSAGLDAARGLVEHSADKTIGHGAILPRGQTALRAIVDNPVTWLLIAAGLCQTVAVAVRRPAADRGRALMLLAFALPLLTPIFYRNAYPYYYAWIMAPAALLVGAGALRLTDARRLVVTVLFLVGTALLYHQRAATPILPAQRATIAAVRAIFPSPVAYIDRASMVGSFRKVGPFMSSWGMENYHAAGRPVMRDVLLTGAPPLLIANSPVLESALTGRPIRGDIRALLPADAAALRANFIHHWGPLWVAGKTLELGVAPSRFEIVLPGRYTVEARSAVVLDGARRRPGDVVTLAAGAHSIASAPGTQTQTVHLRWGDHLARPIGRPPAHPLFARL